MHRGSAQTTTWLKALIYGAFGTGKTHLAASSEDVPDYRDVLYLDSEAGSLTISHRHDLDRVQVRTFGQLNSIKEYLIRHAQMRDKGDLAGLCKLEEMIRGQVVTTPRQYRTIVLDSISEMYKLLMYDLLGIQLGKTALDIQFDNPEFADWNQASSKTLYMIRVFRDMPFNVIFVASEQVKEDERKMRFISPNLSGKLASEIQGFMDLVGYLGIQHAPDGTSKRFLAIESGPNFAAKNRFANTDVRSIANPTMAHIIHLQKGQAGQAGQKGTSS